MNSNEMYTAIKLAKSKIAEMDFDEILQVYLKFRGVENPDRNTTAFMKVVEAGTFIDHTRRGEFCLSFEMPGTITVMNTISDNRIVIVFKHPVDDGFEIDQTVNFDLHQMINDVDRAEALKKVIGEFNMNGLFRALLGGDDVEQIENICKQKDPANTSMDTPVRSIEVRTSTSVSGTLHLEGTVSDIIQKLSLLLNSDTIIKADVEF